MKKQTIISVLFGAMGLSMAFSSCDDMLDKGNDYVIYADDHYLNTAADTVSSLVGILGKLQAIAVRTNLFGELRGDLVEVEDFAKNDLKAISNFSILTPKGVGEAENVYNNPRDYYSVINSCNFFLERADSTAGANNSIKKYFEAEIAQVHSIRAWVYLQLALVYGKVPYITKPLLTKYDADAAEYDTSNQKTLDEVVDELIKDLEPYASPYADIEKELPAPGNFGIDQYEPKYSFFPVQLVMGDLYLWKAALNGKSDKEAAKAAALCYYKFITSTQSGKERMATSTQQAAWGSYSIDNQRYQNETPSRLYGTSSPFMNLAAGTWGKPASQTITCILMSSEASDASYNELRDLYYLQNTETQNGPCLQPSQPLKQLSAAQTYADENSNDVVVTVSPEQLTTEQLNRYCGGDLRLYSTLYYSYPKNKGEIQEMVQNLKHEGSHVSVYRNTQVWLRFAEALNYAGYPRFARMILTTGIDQSVLDNAVKPYYPGDEDAAFLNNFIFLSALNGTSVYKAVDGFAVVPFTAGVDDKDSRKGTYYRVKSREPNYAQSGNTMIGIHSRGCGRAYRIEDYCPLVEVDSLGFPETEYQAFHDYSLLLPKEPTRVSEPYDLMPSTWEEHEGETLAMADYFAFMPEVPNTTREYQNYCDTVKAWVKYLYTDKPAYEAEQAAYDAVYVPYCDARDAFTKAYKEWNIQHYAQSVAPEQAIVDQAILDEQALELAFEGNRYYDLMRRALYWQDKTKLSDPIEKRVNSDNAKGKSVAMPAFGDHVSRTNWFLNWRGKLGL